jgi:hypothetical protein
MRVSGLVAAVIIMLGARPAWAQDGPPRLLRGDVSGTLGWFNVNKSHIDTYDDWRNRSLFGGLGMGWYWTNHLKTDVEVGATTKIRVYAPTSIDIGGPRTLVPSTYHFGTRRVRVSQYYQFRDNQWFHPFLGMGVDIVNERVERHDEPLYIYDPVTRQSRLLRDRREYSDRTETRAFASASAGFKAYLSPRGFFLMDLRTTFDSRAEEVLLRFGFGVDF